MKKIIYIIGLLSIMFCSCADLDQYPHKETTSKDVYNTVANYEAVLGKLYVSFVLKGQEKGGDYDLDSNRNEDYMRCYFNLQEAGTDEVASTWLSGDMVSDLTYLSWDVNDPWVSDMYYRIYYTISLCNEFLRNAGDGQIAKFSEAEQVTLREYRAEARFIRALAYSHALDLFRNVPFVTEADPVGAFTPPRYTGVQIFEYIESELKDIESELLDKSKSIYGRASQDAAYALLARLYLNAEVYTGTARYTDCITYTQKIIGTSYSLESDYAKLFNADNDKRTNEIIFAFPVDAVHTVSWGSTTYIICGAVSNSSAYQKPADYGVGNGWGMFRARGNLSRLFDVADSRRMFFTEGQIEKVDVVDDQSNGYFVTKWTNLTDAGQAASNTVNDGVNTDFPVFRLADVYLMLAESVLRGGTGSSKSEALALINQLRSRSFGTQYDALGKVKETQLDLELIIQERARELYWEGIRRTDLVRFGMFTTNKYLWEWKGGAKDGVAVSSKYNIYPIPATELVANPNLYNEDY